MIDVAALYESHHVAVLRYLRLRTNGDGRLAEDLAQEVWVKVHRAAATYEDRGKSPEAWLFRIARNLVIDHVRRQQRGHAVSMEAVGELAAVTSDAGNERQLDGLDIERLVERLTPKQARVIRARYLRGMSIVETKLATGITENGVKKLQARALVNLRRMLEAA